MTNSIPKVEKLLSLEQAWWHTFIIQAIWETERRGSQFETSLGKKLARTHLSKQTRLGGHISVIKAVQEAEIGGSRSEDSLRKKCGTLSAE
jgi:hypothetical protein